MVSSRPWTATEVAALRRVTLWVGDRPVLLSDSPEEPVVITPSELSHLNIRFPVNELDDSTLELQMDFDPDLGGYPLSFFTPSDGRREAVSGPMIQMAAQRFMGDSLVALIYKGKPVPFAQGMLRFQPSDDLRSQFDYMREALRRENALVLDFYGLANLWSEWDSDGDDQVPINLQMFELVRWAYRRLAPILHRMSLDPIRDLVQVEERLPLQNARSINATSIRHAVAAGTPWTKVALSALPRVGALPVAVPVQRTGISYATPENAYVRDFVLELIGHTRRLRALTKNECTYLQNVLPARLGEWRNQTRGQLNRALRSLRLLGQIESHLSALLHEPFLHHRHPAGRDTSSHRLVSHPLYHQLWRTARQFRWGVRLAGNLINVNALPMKTRSMNVLYEYWLAAAVHRVLVDKVGLTPVRRNGRFLDIDHSKLNAIVTEGTSVEMMLPSGLTCRLHYGKRYPSLRQSTSALVGMEPAIVDGVIQRKDTPDLALEFQRPGEEIPIIVTIDATYTHNTHRLHEKSYYLDTIRARRHPDEPESAWEFPVCEAWAVYPGSSRTRPRRNFTGGEFGLVPGPGAEEDLEIWLREIINRVL